ncbi:MAG: hypothetical protein JNN28_01630 [Saprospiraceae bacterium]|nr:hypothetical protein [Saprospiraceae bacterium]
MLRFNHHFPPEQIHAWAKQFQETDRAILWAIRGLAPLVLVLWYQKYAKDNPSYDLSSPVSTAQLEQVLPDREVLTQALAAFSTVKPVTIKALLPAVLQHLSQVLKATYASKSRAELKVLLPREIAEAQVLIPAAVRAVCPTLQTIPLVKAKNQASNQWVAWMQGFICVLTLATIFYFLLIKA